MHSLRRFGLTTLRHGHASSSKIVLTGSSQLQPCRTIRMSPVRLDEKDAESQDEHTQDSVREPKTESLNEVADHPEPQASQKAANADAELTSTKYLDELLKHPDAFHRDENMIQRPSSWPNRVNPTVLNGPMYQRAQKELNQEWDLPSSNSGETTSKMRSNSPAGTGPKQRRRREEVTSGLTESELSGFDKLFQDILRSDLMGKANKPDTQSEQPKFASTLSGGDRSQQFQMLWNKTKGRRQKMRSGDTDSVHKRNRLSSTGTIALVHERIAASKLSEEDIARGIDQAKEQMLMCQTQEEVWNWALANVWGVEKPQDDVERQLDMKAGDGEVGPLSNEKNSAAGSELGDVGGVAGPSFGLETPFYAPVLHILLKELRDRFRAPHAALSVLRLTRGLSAESAVLGCTSHLYAEALRTCWRVLRDLQTALDLVVEAKESGILTGALTHRAFGPMSAKAQNNDSVDFFADVRNDQIIDSVVEYIKHDVQRLVVRADRAIRLNEPQQPLARTLLRMQEMVKEMSDIVRNKNKGKRSNVDGTNARFDRFESQYRNSSPLLRGPSQQADSLYSTTDAGSHL